MPSLFVIRGNDQGARFEFEQTRVTVGREASNTLQLRDNEVSRHHAELRWHDNSHTLYDLNSSNGTFVNGRRVTQQRLNSGDQLLMGRTLILYTGPTTSGDEEINTAVDISGAQLVDERSKIIHALPQAEGSRLFQFPSVGSRDVWLSRAQSTLQMVYQISLAISHTLDIEQLLQRLLELVFQWVEADRGCIMLVNPDTKQLEPKARRTRQGAREEKIVISKTILDYVLEKNEGVLTSDARQDQRWNPAASILQAGIREALCVPMKGRYDVVGVIYLHTATSTQESLLTGGAAKFNQDHLKLLIAIAHQAALAIEDTRYYSAMVQAERLAAIGQAVATLSHHIKNILQGINGGSYLIKTGLADHDEGMLAKGWRIVEKNQQKISTLVLDMLTFSKEREPDLQPSNLNEVVGDVMELSQGRAADLEVKLTCELAPVMPRLVFDPEGLHRAILNVVTNAVDAACETDRAALVSVRTEFAAEEGKIRVIVQDNGGGVSSDHLPTLFNPFSSSKKGRGTGLGLSVSQKILSEHGGRIYLAESSAAGSRFVLELPAVVAENPSQTVPFPTQFDAQDI